MKKETDLDYVNKVKDYDQGWKRQKTSRSSRSLSESNAPLTPIKQKWPKSYYRVLSTSKKVQDILRPSPNMHTMVLKHVLKKAMRSPRKSTRLPEYSAGMSKDFITPLKDPTIARQLCKIAILKSRKRHDKARSAAVCLWSKYKTISNIANKSGESHQAVYRFLSQTNERRLKSEYVRKLTSVDRAKVIRIYNNDEVSYSLPDMKYTGMRFMLFTLSEAYSVYLCRCTTKQQVAEKTFESLKPRYIRTLQETQLWGAPCDYCANFAKTREALIAVGIKGIPRNHPSTIEETWCSFRTCECDVMNLCHTELPRKECALRKCEQCRVTAYKRKIILNNKARMSLLKNVSWKLRELVKYINKNGKEKKKTEIVHHTGSVVNLMRCYFKQLREMSVHQFFKIWQLCNFNLSLSNIWRGQVLFVHNFQQNLLLLTQDETLAAHWDHPQLTIHPKALFYLCLKCDKIVKEDLIHIIMDKVHDKHAVNQFTQTSIEHIQQKGILIEEIIEFTDHSASQYKSQYTFYYIMKLGIPCTRHYFSVKHGKGPSDRAGGNFKRTIRAAVKGGHELLHANAIEEYCKVNFD